MLDLDLFSAAPTTQKQAFEHRMNLHFEYEGQYESDYGGICVVHSIFSRFP